MASTVGGPGCRILFKVCAGAHDLRVQLHNSGKAMSGGSVKLFVPCHGPNTSELPAALVSEASGIISSAEPQSYLQSKSSGLFLEWSRYLKGPKTLLSSRWT